MTTISLHPPVKSRDRRGGGGGGGATPTSGHTPSSSPGHRPTSPRLNYRYPPPTSTNFPTSPYHRPTSPHNRPTSPYNRPVSPHNRPVSPHNRPVSPHNRPVSPSPYNRPTSPYNRPTSPYNRPTSPYNRPVSPHNRPVSPHYKTNGLYNRPVSPHNRPASFKDTTSTSNPSQQKHRRTGAKLDPPINTSGDNEPLLPRPTPVHPEPVTSRSLQCAVCMKNYKDARILPCFHTFCAPCLERSCLEKRMIKDCKVDTVYCPVCMDSSELPSRGVQGLPKNMYVEHLQDIQRSSVAPQQQQPTCDLCVTSELAVKRCQRCDCNLCEFCMHAHQKQRKTSLHQLLDLKRPVNGPRVTGVARIAGSRYGRGTVPNTERRKVVRCDKHAQEEVQFHCRDCNVPLCKKCALADHNRHAIVPLEEVDPRYSELLQGLLTRTQPLAATLNESVRNLEFVANNIQRRAEAVSEEIIDYISSRMKALQEHKRCLLLQLDAIKKQKENTLKIQMAHLSEVLSELNSSCDKASRALADGTPSVAFTSTSSSIAGKLEELVSTKLETTPQEDDYIHFHSHLPAEDRGGFSMFGVLDARGPSAANTTAEGEGLYAAQEGKVAQFKVHIHDRYKQPREMGGDKLEAVLSDADTGETVNVSIGDNKDGTCMLSYAPKSTGEHRLSILVEGKHIRGSPFAVSVRRKANRHRGVFHCCTFCSSEGKKHIKCGCGSTMPGGYSGCGHGHLGHPGRRHWSCCGSTVEMSDCTCTVNN